MWGLHQTSAALHTAKSRGPDAPTLASSWRKMILPMTGAIKPGTPAALRESAYKPLNHCAGNAEADCFGVPVVTCLRAFFHCTQGCGCDKHPASPAPSLSEGANFMTSPARMASRRGSRMFSSCFSGSQGCFPLFDETSRL
jgi:hypothetical protein